MNNDDKGSQFNPRISRRTFNKAMVGAGVTAAAINILPGCASSPAPSSDPSSTETKTLHFDLSGHPSGNTFELRLFGKRYDLSPHTMETIQEEIRKFPQLAELGDKVTHFIQGVELSAVAPQILSVTTNDMRRGPGLVHVGIHIPSVARANSQARLGKTNRKEVCGEVAGVMCDIHDELDDDFITAYDTAKAIVMHHPEIINLDSDVAAQVELHIANSAEVMNLAQSICAQGPAFQKDPDYVDGWCVLVPVYNHDGTPKLDRYNKQIFDYKFSVETCNQLKPAVNDVLSRIKNDPTLKDKMYAVRPRDTADASITAKVSERYRLWKSGGVNVTRLKSGTVHNVSFEQPVFTGSGSTRSFSINITNWNFIWYGVYLEYLDAQNRPIELYSSAGNALYNTAGSIIDWADSGNENISRVERDALRWMQTSILQWENIISSPPTIFGVPIKPWPTEVAVTMPDGASSVRIILSGAGHHGKVDYPVSTVPGWILTIIFQYAIPAYFVYDGKGINKDNDLWDYFKKNPGVSLKLIFALASATKDIINPTSANDAATAGSFESLGATMIEEAIILLTGGALPKLTKWLAEKKGEEEAEDAVPFVGWTVRIVTLLGTLADIAISIAEISTTPMCIDNTVAFTASVTVTVHCDPGNYQFPEESTYYEVQFTVSDASFPDKPKWYTLTQADRGSRSFTIPIDDVPTTGSSGKDAVEIWFYSDSSKTWLAAHGKAVFDNVSVNGGAITASVTIVQNPIPLTSSTVYSQHRKLEFLSGKYVWNEDNPAIPALEAGNCGNGLCDLTNISVWTPGGMLGYSWQANNQHYVKNINAQEADPNPGMKLIISGTGAPTPIAYDKTIPYPLVGNHFYLDPVNISIDNAAYYLRRLNLDPASSNFNTRESWGRFPIQLDRLAVHPLGYVIGISTNNHKLAVLRLPEGPYASDANTNNAVLKLGQGENDKFVIQPQALTVSRSGAILILEGAGTSRSIKAFDVFGNPWLFFKNGTVSSFALQEEDAKWLDIAIDDTEFIYVLSYTGSGMLRNDYRLDVYDKQGSRVFRNVGISVSRMVVDKWRRLYSLNQETMKGSPIVEPTVSVWMPNTP
jgi:hypothetical protein